MKKELFLKLGGPAALLTFAVTAILLSGWCIAATGWMAILVTVFCLSLINWKVTKGKGKHGVPELDELYADEYLSVVGFAPPAQLRNVGLLGWLYAICTIATLLLMQDATWDARYYTDHGYRVVMLISGSVAWFLFSWLILWVFRSYHLHLFVKYWWHHIILEEPGAEAEQTA